MSLVSHQMQQQQQQQLLGQQQQQQQLLGQQQQQQQLLGQQQQQQQLLGQQQQQQQLLGQQQQQHQQQINQQQQLIGQQQQQVNLQQQQQQQPPRSQPQEDKSVSQARKLVSGPLKEKWSLTLREAAVRLYQNGLQDSGNYSTVVSAPNQKFESNLEDFHAICDQIELNLKCAIECIRQSTSSNRYMPIPPNLTRMDVSGCNGSNEYLTYPQYIYTSKQQIKFANDVRAMLKEAASDVE